VPCGILMGIDGALNLETAVVADCVKVGDRGVDGFVVDSCVNGLMVYGYIFRLMPDLLFGVDRRRRRWA